MWLLILVVSVTNVTSTPNSRVLLESTPTVFIHNEEAALEYFEATQKHPDRESLARYKELDKANREKLCLKYLASPAASFSKPGDKFNPDPAKEEWADLVGETFQSENNPIIEEFTFKTSRGQLEASAHICISEGNRGSWAISPGFHENVYFVLNNPVNSQEFRLFGLLEEAPLTTDHKVDLEKQQKLYETGSEWGSDLFPKLHEKKKTKSLCSLNMNERFRLCAAAKLAEKYDSYRDFKFKVTYFISQDIPEKYQCIKSNIMIYEYKTVKRNIPADFVSCAYNESWEHADIFLTNDPHSSDSVFIVNPMWVKGVWKPNIYDEVRGFKVGQHLTDISVLKPFPDDEEHLILPEYEFETKSNNPFSK